MGSTQSTWGPVHSEIIIMKAFIFATVLAVAAAIPIEDTDDVKAAKVEFSAAFKAAQAGEHAKLAPSPVATAYLADLPEVSDARDAFRAVYDKFAAGEAKPVVTAYIADTQEVSDARDAFRVVYDKYAAGDVAHPVAPIHEVAPIVTTKAIAPVAYAANAVAPVTVAASYWNNYYGAYPYTHTAYAGYPYAHTGYPYAHTAYPYAHAGYAGYYGAYPYALSTVAVAPTKAV